MSRNFELLQQLNGSAAGYSDVLSLPSTETAAGPVASVLPAERSSATGSEASLNLEEQKLVNRLFLEAKPSPRVVVFTGLDGGSGCTYLCSRTAELLAQKHSGKVCLLDANLRNPSLHRVFDLENGAGLADALVEAADIRSYARQLPQEKLWLITAGTEMPEAYTLLGSDKLAGYITELRRSFDYVLIDSPPASPYTDSVVLGAMSDGVALVVKAHSSRRATATKIVEDFAAARVRVLGAVLNQRTFPVPEAIYSRL
ncbi:MAG TPA: CpsD/CapB family tyrosine-protein kinase [Terriglobales bacterium]|jgi:capsular exopolysaccharide synthesis family protein|nr:CpsD/CapB family tyrosine-protein kinase [Terriglobales bacterium]